MCGRFSLPGFVVSSSSAQQTASFSRVLKDQVKADFSRLFRYSPVGQGARKIPRVSVISEVFASSGKTVARDSRTRSSGTTTRRKNPTQETGSDSDHIHHIYGNSSFYCGGYDLAGQSVLCVGGRARLYREYRQLVKAYGGDLVICRSSRAETDDAGVGGSVGDNPVEGRLDTLLACADMVVCPVDCIDHTDYFTVRHYCKRTGKPCAFLRHSCLPSFCKGVEVLAGCVPRPAVVAPGADGNGGMAVSACCEG